MPEIPPHILAAFAAGLLGFALVEAWIALVRRSKRKAGPPPAALGAEAALEYCDSPAERHRSQDMAHPSIVLMLLIMAFGDGAFEPADWIFIGLAAVAAATTPPEIARIVRRLNVGPAIALHGHGLYLASRRGVAYLPWSALEAVYTDPPDSDGYVAPEDKVTLHVEARDGRSWRFSSGHFDEGAPAEFARIAAVAAWRMAPPGSMLRQAPTLAP